MSFAMDLIPSGHRDSHDLELGAWPATFQPSAKELEQGYEQYMDLACSASGSCPADFAKGELQPAPSLDSIPSALGAQLRSRSNELSTSEPSKRLNAAERKLHSNRQAQKRFRQRQKVRPTVLLST